VQEKFKQLAVLVDKEEKEDADAEEEEEGGDDTNSRLVGEEEEDKEGMANEFDESPEDEASFCCCNYQPLRYR
jgi:hypothetical protein